MPPSETHRESERCCDLDTTQFVQPDAPSRSPFLVFSEVETQCGRLTVQIPSLRSHSEVAPFALGKQSVHS